MVQLTNGEANDREKSYLKDVFEQQCRKYSEGLIVTSLPTGIGKTHAYRCLALDMLMLRIEKEMKTSEERKLRPKKEWFERDIYVITPLKKNLEYKEFVEEAKKECIKRYKDDHERLKRAIDYIEEKVAMYESRSDYVANYLFHCNDDEYDRRMREIENTGILNDDELELRSMKSDIKFLRDRFKSKGSLDEKSSNELDDYAGRIVSAASTQASRRRKGYSSTWPDKWKWLEVMYKDMSWGTSWVSFLSTQKAVSTINTVEKKHATLFMDKDIKGALIIMDEYDASMWNILTHETEQALREDCNLISLVRNTCRGLRTVPNKSIFSGDSHIDEYNKTKDIKKWTVKKWHGNLKKLCNNTYKTLAMDRVIKSVIPEGMNKAPSAFIFTRSNSLIVVMGTGGTGRKGKSWNAVVEINRKGTDENKIYYTQEDVKTHNAQGIEVMEAVEYVGKCHTYVDTYINGLSRIALEIHEQAIREARRASNEGKKVVEPSIRNTVQSILNMYSGGTHAAKILCEPVTSTTETLMRIKRTPELRAFDTTNVQKKINEWEKKYSLKSDSYDPYERGLRFTAFYESDDDRYQTDIHYYSIPRMPDFYIVSGAMRNLLLCWSATAKLYNPVGNFDDYYIRRKLGELYHHLDEAELDKIRETQEAYNRIVYVDKTNEALNSDPGYDVDKILYPEVGKQLPCYASALPYRAEKKECGGDKINSPEKIDMAKKMLEKLCVKIGCPFDVDGGVDSEALAGKIVLALGDENDWYKIARYFRFFQSYVIFRRGPGSFCIGFYNLLANERNESKFSIDVLRKLASCSNEICERSGRGHRPTPDLEVMESKGFEQTKKDLASRTGNRERLYVLTTYPTVGAGQNLHYAVATTKDRAFCVGRPVKQDGHIYVDVDTLYLDEPTYVLPTPPKKGEGSKKRNRLIVDMANIATRIYEGMANSGALPSGGKCDYERCIRENIQKTFRLTAETEADVDNGERQGNDMQYRWPTEDCKRKLSNKGVNKRENYYAAKVAGMVIQALGRMSRTNGKRCVPSVLYDPELSAIIKRAKLPKNEIYNVETVAVIDSACAYGMDRLSEEDRIHVEKNSRIAIEGRNTVRDILSALMSGDGDVRANAVIWAWIREMTLAYPVIDADLKGEALWNRCGKERLEKVAEKYGASNIVPNVSPRARALLKTMYVYIPEGSSYWYTNVDYGTSIRVYHRKDIAESMDTDVYEASETGARLDKIMESKEMKAYFDFCKYATSFPMSHGPRQIIAPEYYQSVYKGALGEVAGEYMLNKHLHPYGLECAPMPFEYTETMDSAIIAEDGTPTGIYVDYKNWSKNSSLDTMDLLESYQNKTKKLSAKRMVVINMYDPDPGCCFCSYGNNTSVISGVFGPGGEVRTGLLEELCKKIYETVQCGDAPEGSDSLENMSENENKETDEGEDE